MAQHKQSEHERQHNSRSSSDPRQQNQTSTGRGESGAAHNETVSGSRQASTSSGRSSNESDARGRDTREPEGLTMGTNGGERIGAPSSAHREKQGSLTSSPRRHRKAA